MIKKKFPHIRLDNISTKGNYFGAYESNDDDSKKGYTVFISTSEDEKTYCECMGFVHGKICYHIKRAKELLGIPKV